MPKRHLTPGRLWRGRYVMSSVEARAPLGSKKLPPARYDYGGDEFVFVELDEEMSLQVNFKAMAITRVLARGKLPGIVEICPANASYLIRFNPDQLRAAELIAELRKIDESVGDDVEYSFRTRVIDVPVLYGDPWTHETMMKFRDCRQDPNATDVEFTARVNGFKTAADFIEAHHRPPYFVTMVGFVPGTPWCLPMTPHEGIFQAPKYIRPRTDTPELALGHGGAFATIYPVRGPGGYQLLGVCAAPVFDPEQGLEDFKESLVFLRPGDIVKFRPIHRVEFDNIRRSVKNRAFRYRVRHTVFEPRKFFQNPLRYNDELLAGLYGD